MRAKDQKIEDIKGIYYNEISGNTYFVNEVLVDRVRVSAVLTRKIDMGGSAMIKVLNGSKPIPMDVFREFKFSGAYTRECINSN